MSEDSRQVRQLPNPNEADHCSPHKAPTSALGRPEVGNDPQRRAIAEDTVVANWIALVTGFSAFDDKP